jgi:hypothetical protein
MAKATARKKPNPVLFCPVCFSDRLQTISVRMKKCVSCGFIWNHEVSDRDNLMLIVEHQSKWQAETENPPTLKIVASNSQTSSARTTAKRKRAK